MHQGKIIEFIEQGRFVSTLCLQDKGNRLHLLTSTNREVNLSPKRALLVSSSSIDPLRPREELLDRLRETESLRDALKCRVNVEELWELVKGEEERFSHRYLAELCFGQSISDDHLSALARALFEDRLYFRLKDGMFLPNSGEKVEQIVREREEEAAREEKLQAGSAWLKEIRLGRRPLRPACGREVIDLLAQLALYGREAPEYKLAKELLSKAGINDISKARSLLVDMGEWEEDENLDLVRLEIRTEFGEEKLKASADLAATAVRFEGREDLRTLPLLTIDGPLTRDFDDALSLELQEGELHLGIHIADVAEWILPESTLDREAFSRSSSLYLPRRQIPMIPPDLSQETLSLKGGCERLAISLLARFDQGGNLMEYRFAPSIVCVERQLTYDAVNDMLESDPTLKRLHDLSVTLRRMRAERDAVSLSLPELEVHFSHDGLFQLKMVEQNTPSRALVAEFMILYNWLFARFCRDQEIPILFRTQMEPSERLTEDHLGYVYYVFKQRRKLNPLKITTVPGPHSGLGLDLYTNATSPIRRYLDLIAQRQVKAFLSEGRAAYDEKALEDMRMSLEPVLKALDRVKRNRLRYWVLKYLRRHMGNKYEAIVLDVMKNKYRILLLDFLYIAELRRDEKADLYPGQPLNVLIRKCDPWEDTLEVGYGGD